jgi:hypothetical protein
LNDLSSDLFYDFVTFPDAVKVKFSREILIAGKFHSGEIRRPIRMFFVIFSGLVANEELAAYSSRTRIVKRLGLPPF